MVKQINVCDFCEKEKTLNKCDSFEICHDCEIIYYKAKDESRKVIQSHVDFTVVNRENLIHLLKENDSIKYWGKDGIKMREKILSEL